MEIASKLAGMIDITDKMLAYRECVRGLWNTYLRDGADFDSVDVFEDICRKLFSELILAQTGASSGILVKPGLDPLRIMIHRPTEQGKYWDDPVTSLKPGGLVMSFIDFYDFNNLDYIDLRYCRIKIVQCAEHPALTGREALVDVQHVRLEHEEE